MQRVVATATEGVAVPRVGWGFITLYASAYVGTWLALLTPIMVTLALRAEELAPASSEYWHSLVLSVGALFALVGNPLFGWLSDRTTSSWGMRRPWLVFGSLAGATSLAFVALAPSIGWLLAGWCLAQLSFNAVLAPLAALLPDHIPAERRGTVAGIISISTPIGQIGGTYLIQALAGDMTAMVTVPGAVCVALVLLLAIALPDRRLSPEQAKPVRWRALLHTFWVSPGRAPDFSWVCAGRFFLILCMSFLMAYQPFLLMRQLGIAAEDVPDIVFRVTLLQAGMVVIAGLLAGRLSDLVARRKPFIVCAGIAGGFGAGVMAMASSYDVYLVGVAIFGLGLGAYLGVDLALITDVLPNREGDAAKDLGLFNIASALPQSIAPAMASLILLQAGGNYAAVFFAAAVASVLAAIAVVPVRSVR